MANLVDNLPSKVLLGMTAGERESLEGDSANTPLATIKDAQKRYTGEELSDADASTAKTALDGLKAVLGSDTLSALNSSINARQDIESGQTVLQGKTLAADAGQRGILNKIDDDAADIDRVDQTLIGYVAADMNMTLQVMFVILVVFTLVVVPVGEYAISTYVLRRPPAIMKTLSGGGFMAIAAVLIFWIVLRSVQMWFGA